MMIEPYTMHPDEHGGIALSWREGLFLMVSAAILTYLVNKRK